ncbi:hypothetical protein PGT21_025634 [Puccinia graminis f. sp. tritici]|uniref:Uncharacterized protein n=1 Tax=Puccinia graminis f. sp. tritici TaxID=56615 RepID=A0A5B0NK12_PUCGR|nr:hypothetical protein PGT21_025634 [Puccinia graminis f. sp. tritici]
MARDLNFITVSCVLARYPTTLVSFVLAPYPTTLLHPQDPTTLLQTSHLFRDFYLSSFLLRYLILWNDSSSLDSRLLYSNRCK